MKKDIFIDNNIAKNFTNPMDPEYVKLIKWLMASKDVPEGKDDHINAHIVVSQKLLNEYNRSAMNASSATCIHVIIEFLQRNKRLIRISNDAIKEFRNEHFTKAVERKLASNNEDRDHIPVVLLSHRQYALSIDDNFIKDLKGFPKFNVTVAKRPQDIAYAS